MNSDLFLLEYSLKVKNTQKLTRCNKCYSVILINHIQIRQTFKGKKVRYHLKDFRPAFPQYLISSKMTIKLTDSTRPIFNTWLENINSRFHSTVSTCQKFLSNKILQFKPPSQKRQFLEIFKFLDVFDLTNSVSLVNHNFYELCWESELWQFLLFRDFQVPAFINPKNKYLEELSKVCFECRVESVENLLFICPALNKKLCCKCMNSEKYELMHQKDVYKYFGFKGDLVKVKSLKTDESGWISYKFLFKEEVNKFRMKNKNKVLEMLKHMGRDQELYKCVEKIDVLSIGNKIEVKNGKEAKILGLKSKGKGMRKLIRKFYKFIAKGEGKIYANSIEKTLE